MLFLCELGQYEGWKETTLVPENTKCLEVDNVKKETQQSEQLTQTLTTLYVRHGLLMSLGSKSLTREIAEALIDDFKSRWEHRKASYKECVSLAAKVSVSALEFTDDDFYLEWKEPTFTCNWPRIRISDGESIFDVRTCLAICISKASSKFWSRVTLPVDKPGTSPRLRWGQVSGLCPRFRDIADKSNRWAFDEIREILPNHLPDSRPATRGIIKATILGIADSKLVAPFEQLYDEEVTAANVLQDPALDQKLTAYCRNVSDIVGTLSSYTKQTALNSPIWFKIPMCAVLSGGETAHRIVLFLMRDVEGYSEIIGLACDDSEKGDIALRAGAKLGKIIGQWI